MARQHARPLPTCLGNFGDKPNVCGSCPYANICRTVVAKSRLKSRLAPFLDLLSEMQAILREIRQIQLKESWEEEK